MYGKLEKLTERLLTMLNPSIEEATTQQHIDQPTAVSEYFTLPSHSMDNIELVPLKLVTSKRDAIRKVREAFLICKGKTLEPSMLNMRDQT